MIRDLLLHRIGLTVNHPSTTHTNCVQQFRISSELRRCCWYGIVGSVIIVLASYYLGMHVLNRGANSVYASCLAFGILGGSLTLPLSWRLVVHETGITRQWLFRRDEWSWRAFASGEIVKEHSYTLIDRTRPWWRRNLRLDILSRDDIRKVVSQINDHYKLPPPPDKVESLKLRYGIRKSVKLNKQGIHVVERVPREYLWSDVESLLIERMDPLRRDFRRLVLRFPDYEIDLQLKRTSGGISQTWSGASPAQINEFLSSHVAEEKRNVVTFDPVPENAEHLQLKLKAAEKTAREFSMVMSIFAILISGAILWMAFEHGIQKAIFMTLALCIYPGSVVFFSARTLKNRQAELENALRVSNGKTNPFESITTS